MFSFYLFIFFSVCNFFPSLHVVLLFHCVLNPIAFNSVGVHPFVGKYKTAFTAICRQGLSGGHCKNITERWKGMFITLSCY